MVTKAPCFTFFFCNFAKPNQTKKEKEHYYDKTISKNITTNYRFNATK
jgi:hypothetical protein